MAFGVREWLITIGLAAILVILIDAVRRYRKHQRADLKMDLDLTGSVSGDPFHFPLNPELPNGGGRLIDEVGQLLPGEANNDALLEQSGWLEQADGQAVSSSPVMGSEPLNTQPAASCKISTREHNVARKATAPIAKPWEQGLDMGQVDGDKVGQAMFRTHRKRAVRLGQSLMGNSVRQGHTSRANDTRSSGNMDAAVRVEPPEPRDVLVINIMAKSGAKLSGPHILQTVLSLGFRYGEHSVFHFYERQGLKEYPLCSLTNALKPGTFDLGAMENFETEALSLFLPLPGPLSLEGAFSQFLSLAHRLSEQLDAELKDEAKTALTQEKLLKMHDRVLKIAEGPSPEVAATKVSQVPSDRVLHPEVS